MQERPRSLLNACLVRGLVGSPVSAEELAKALRVKATIHYLKRNGKCNMVGRTLRLFTVVNTLRRDLL